MKSNRKEKKSKKSEPATWLASLFVRIRANSDFTIALGVLAVVVIIAGAVLYASFPNPDPVEQIVDDLLGEDVERHPLTGVEIDEAYEIFPQVFAVMIENSADAWPLSGLDQAFMVIEAPVEAGIPRFIAFFSDESDEDKIGPVRSARPYYVDWAYSLQAMYVHVGGSPAALEHIADVEMIDLNQFWFGEYFWRENGTRYAPHNVYTSTEALIEAVEAFDLEAPSYDRWNFTEMEPAQDPVSDIAVNFADGTLYDSDWEYDAEQETYLRYQSGSVMRMEDGAEIWADTVAVLAMDIRTIDNIGRKSIDTISVGDAMLFRNGHADLVMWRMQEDGRLTFYRNGEEEEMHPGVIWMEIVNDLSQVEYN